MKSCTCLQGDPAHRGPDHDIPVAPGRSGASLRVTRLTSGAKFRAPMLGVVNEKALVELGWPRLCAELSTRARTPMGRERCLALLPGDDADAARTRGRWSRPSCCRSRD